MKLREHRSCNAFRTRPFLRSSAVAFVIIILSSPCADNAEARITVTADEVIGDKNNNRIVGRNDRVVYGLKGNDRLISCRRCTTMFIGGSGSDTYVVFARTQAIIMDNSARGTDTYKSSTMSWRSSGALRTYFATFDNRHFVAVSGNRAIFSSGRIITGAMFVNWKYKAHEIERFTLRDGSRSGKWLRKNYRRTSNWIGDIPFSEIGELGFVSEDRRAFARGIRILVRRERRFSRSRYNVSDKIYLSAVDYQAGRLDDGFLSMPTLGYAMNDRATIEFGSTIGASRYFDARQMLSADGQYSSDSQFLNFAELDGLMVNAKYDIGPTLSANIVWFSQPLRDFNSSYGQSTLVKGQAISMSYRVGDDTTIGALATRERERGSVFGRSVGENWLRFKETTSTKVGVTAAYHPTDSIAVSAWSQYAVGDVELEFSPFLGKPEGVAAYGWGLTVEARDTIRFGDRISFGVNEPYGLQQGKARFAFAEFMGRKDGFIPMVSSARELDASVNYEMRVNKSTFSTFFTYSLNPNKIRGARDVELIFQLSVPY
jgi:hypothetical protein